MKIQTSDYLLARSSLWFRPLLRWMGNRETAMLREDLTSVEIRQPVFITGLARAGTTIMLETLASIPGFTSHRYRDFPFLMVPHHWNQYVDKLAANEEPVERAHGDRIKITRESPEAFEEPIWQAFFPNVHSTTDIHRLDGSTEHAKFEKFYRDHIRKLLWIRSGERYLSKGNYNVSRIEYLAKLFPDARFIVVIRNPLTHIHSLVRQHQRFTQFAQKDPRVPRYLAVAGHYEFGPHRVPIRFDSDGGDRILDAWAKGDDYLGYAIQWADVYRFANGLRGNNELASRIQVVRYEDFCNAPKKTLRTILEGVGANTGRAATVLQRVTETISGSTHTPELKAGLHRRLAEITGPVGAAYGYDLES